MVFIVYLQKPIDYWSFSSLSGLAEKGLYVVFAMEATTGTEG